MRIRNVVAVILTAIVFLSAAALGVSNVYRVDAVTLAYETDDWYEANRFLLFAI